MLAAAGKDEVISKLYEPGLFATGDRAELILRIGVNQFPVKQVPPESTVSL